MRHKNPEGHVHSHTLEPYQLGRVYDLALLKPGTLKPLLGPHTLISSLLGLRWLVCTTSLPLASHRPSFCTPCSQFLLLNAVAAMFPLALLPLCLTHHLGSLEAVQLPCFLPQKGSNFQQGSNDLGNKPLYI